MVRRGLKLSSAFRSAALKMDDMVYGRKPKPKKLKGWLAPGNVSLEKTDLSGQ
jgi:hypothetical protein